MSFFRRADLIQNSDEEGLHNLLLIPPQDSASSPYLRAGVANILSRTPLIVLGAVDASGRPWITIWEGERGFSRAIGESCIVVRAIVDRKFDPVVETLVGTESRGEVIKDLEGERSKGVDILGIDLENSTQINMHGTMLSGALAEEENQRGEIILVLKVTQSLISRAEYFIPKRVAPSALVPPLTPKHVPLTAELVVKFITTAQIFFVLSIEHDMNQNIQLRSGPPGFVQADTNDGSSYTLSYPAYSGIRLYETQPNPDLPSKTALLFPDFHTGQLLYISGTRELLLREDADRVLPQRNVAIRVKIEAMRIVGNSMSFRAFPDYYIAHQPSGFAVQHKLRSQPPESSSVSVEIISKQILTPTIARLRFHIRDSAHTNQWTPGQYVVLGFESILGDNPSYKYRRESSSLDDAFNRKFTVSSGPGQVSGYSEFEITIRNVGHVTETLLYSVEGDDLGILLRGFHGEFFFKQDSDESIGIIAGGIGVTPLLSQASGLDLSRVRVFWAVRAQDLGLVLDSYKREKGLISCTRLFVTSDVDALGSAKIAELRAMDAWVEQRRMQRGDLQLDTASGNRLRKWYICAGSQLRHTLLKWLDGRNVIFETFTY